MMYSSQKRDGDRDTLPAYFLRSPLVSSKAYVYNHIIRIVTATPTGHSLYFLIP